MATFDNKFLVRVGCDTFNHASFITDAMDGFIMQQTSFPYVCTIIDDSSTDGEQEIIRDYLSLNFDLQDTSLSFEKTTDYGRVIFSRHKMNRNCYFAVVLLNENHYSRKKTKIPYITEWSDTKYVAICEGDDYWTDPQKLEKEVNYLEVHYDCTMVFSNAMMRWENNSQPDKLFAVLEERDYSGLEIVEQWIIPTASVVFRRGVLLSDLYKEVLSNKKISILGDTPLFLTCAYFGKLHAFSEVTCVYRKHLGGFLISADSSRKIMLGDYRLEIYKVFGLEYKRISFLTALPHYRVGLWHAMHEKNYRNVFRIIGRFLKIYSVHPAIGYLRIKQIIKEKKANKSSY